MDSVRIMRATISLCNAGDSGCQLKAFQNMSQAIYDSRWLHLIPLSKPDGAAASHV